MFARSRIAALRVALVATVIPLFVLAFVGIAAAEPALPAAGLPPHVATELDTDSCAICHRSHTTSSTDTWRTSVDSQTVRGSLLAGTGASDVGLCYVCHGIELLGSAVDVQTGFEEVSHHLIEPEISTYGPSPKECSSCHDSHGSARITTGTPYPALLRSYDPSGTAVYQGDVYCATCHPDRPADMWDGLAIWNETAHAQLLAPSSPTLVVCLECHEAHGSSIAPILRTSVLASDPPTLTAVAANDRTFCAVCHQGSSATWDGPTLYETSSHASSPATLPIEGEWPAAGASRLVGECQNCHAPMGRNDGAGRAVPKLANALGRALCDSCHDASGPASTDLAALAYPASAAAEPELIAGYSAAVSLEAYGRLELYTRDTTGTTPRALVGPREYGGGSAASAVGAVAVGDVNGDGTSEVLVADPNSARLGIFAFDPLRGISDRVGIGTVPIAAVADFVGVGDTIIEGSGLPEVIVVNRAAASLYVYRYNGTGLALVQGPVIVGSATGMALGHFQRTPRADVALTLTAPDGLLCLSEDVGILKPKGPYATLAGPTAPTIGDAAAGDGEEVVVCNAGEAVNTVSVYNGNGNVLGHYAGGGTGLVPTASAVGNVLPGVSPDGTSGDEVVVTYADPNGASRVDVHPQDKTLGLLAPLSYSIGTRYNPSAIAIGDVNGDGRAEAAIANAGSFTRDNTRVEPSTQIWRADSAGTALLAPETLWAGGAELSGGRTSVAIADVGGVGPTRHPVGGVSPRTHVSTETATVPLHVECVDCHDVHRANATTATAPAANGRILGSWGVAVTNESAGVYQLAQQRGVNYEYELCLKCHSLWAALDGDPDIASQVATTNPSVHAVEGTATTSQATAGSFTGSWSNSSVLYCTDCHGNSVAAEPVGPHRSKEAPLLKSPYAGVRSSDSAGLCYSCHNRDVYFTGTADGVPASTSLFYASNLSLPQSATHSYHTNTLGLGCASCHVSHGSETQPHLIRPDVGYAHAGNGGSCTNACHVGGASHTYSRL